ncbi:hypothetical protein M0802_007090 [Mischocyttarus mexicanus]|nr:hypothetical protein M0802_007090 [Mischocyttarus mexicanus]
MGVQQTTNQRQLFAISHPLIIGRFSFPSSVLSRLLVVAFKGTIEYGVGHVLSAIDTRLHTGYFLIINLCTTNDDYDDYDDDEDDDDDERPREGLRESRRVGV